MSESERRPAQRFEELGVWQKAHEFVLGVYRLTEEFPKREMYGLTAQLRSAAVSVAANVAEGFKRRTVADKRHFLNIAQGSLEECRYYLILARDLSYAHDDTLPELADQTARLLQASYSGLARRSADAASIKPHQSR